MSHLDLRVLFNGGIFYRYNGFDNFPFTTAYDSRFPDVVLQGEGGRLIILESVNGNPINITSSNGGSIWVVHGNARFRGQGDVILHSTDNTYVANWFWNLSSGCWENNGDLRLTGSMRMTMQGSQGLPKATTNGIVQVLGNQKCYLDLNGYEQGVNGLVVSGSAMLTNANANCAPQDMAPQSIWASDQGWLLNEPDGGYRDRSPSALFDGASWTRLRYSTAPSASNPKVFVVRMPANTAETYQYNFRIGYSGASHPSAWKVETSPDGVNWTDSDAHSNVTPPSSPSRAYYNGGVHYRLMSGRDGAPGLAAGANVQVDRGATLDCSRVTGGQTVSSLTVDCAAGTGDGTLVNVAFAAAGEVRLVNFPADTPDVYVVTPVYSVLGVNSDGTATATATVTHLPRGMAFILR